MIKKERSPSEKGRRNKPDSNMKENVTTVGKSEGQKRVAKGNFVILSVEPHIHGLPSILIIR